MTFHKKIFRFILIALSVVAFNALIDLGPLQPSNYVAALNNDLAKTPPMGWNSWNIFAGNIDESGHINVLHICPDMDMLRSHQKEDIVHGDHSDELIRLICHHHAE